MTSSVVVFLLAILLTTGSADINSGCPSWGCLPWGSFSLSAGVPASNGLVKWSTVIEELSSSGDDDYTTPGCVSDQETVVCSTRKGYVSLDPANGKKLWNYTQIMSKPYLPVMDIYGDVIGLDANYLVYVGADGRGKHPINMSMLQPAYSVMLGNNSILFLTSSKPDTAQIVTYLTAGIVDAAIQLQGTVERVNGTFMPSSQPIIAGHRAYLMTRFVPSYPDAPGAAHALGLQRLYAIDLLNQMAPRIVIAWYANFERERTVPRDKEGGRHLDDFLPPIVSYTRGAVFVNNPEGGAGKVTGHQPWPSTLWAIKDEGANSSLLYKTSCFYGQLVVYDTFDRPLSSGVDSGVIWVVNRSPGMIAGYGVVNASMRVEVPLADLLGDRLGYISSQISITRHASDTDVLVMGVSNYNQSFMAAVEVEPVPEGKSRLLWACDVSGGDLQTQDDTTSRVVGQIVNVALPVPHTQNKVTWKLGLAAAVSDSDSKGNSRTRVVGVF